jgi:hypothetical protein
MTEKDIIRDALNELSQLNVKMELQFSDYDDNTWTVPVRLRSSDIESAINDASVKQIRIIITP